jgi:GNAT superfamily N-acetyltransferase
MEPYELIDRNLQRTMSCFARATPGAETREVGSVLITNAAVETPVFNAALLAGPVGDDIVELDRRMATAMVYFQAKGLGWSFWLCEDYVGGKLRKRLDKVAGERGLRRATSCSGMYAEALAQPTRKVPSIECRRVGDEETRIEFCRITSTCFGIPLATSRAIYDTPETWKTAFQAHIAYCDGEAVATAATCVAAGAVGLYSIATLPTYQGLGIAEAVTRYAVDVAKPNGRPLVLQATSAGDSLYRRLGFQEVTNFLVFVSR